MTPAVGWIINVSPGRIFCRLQVEDDPCSSMLSMQKSEMTVVAITTIK